MCGLSPRMRGHHFFLVRLLRAGRSIPADAGAPRQYAEHLEVERVYPRGCGGTYQHNPRRSVIPGLSPRMRGHQSGTPPMLGTSRSIPADAGAPSRQYSSTNRFWVYPRGCGGTPAPVCQEPGATGPSFRVSLRKSDILSQGQSLLLNVWVRAAKCNCSSDSIRFTLVSGGIGVNRPGVDVVVHLPLSFSTGGTASHG